MIFSSTDFLFFFLPVVLLVYYVVPSFWRNPVLLVFSLFFYGWGEPLYIFLMLFAIIVDYIGGILVAKFLPTSRKKAKSAMIGAIVLNLAVLAFFKYWDFFADSISQIPGVPDILNLKDILPDILKSDDPSKESFLPIGISFYTFQSLSYVVDVYRGDGKVQKNPATFGTYVTLFPQLIAGPIVRYCDVDDQLRQRSHRMEMFASGIRTFICGLCKKIILADTAGAMWEYMSSGVDSDPSMIGAWFGLLFYTFQIYFDFSGYSDMAIGLGKMFGFTFRENFYYPYVADSVTDFWRRWHISLSVWFREYVYIPLGGNRKGKVRMILNLFIVWFLTGLWHGAGWNFILWGLYYGILLCIEKMLLGKILPKIPSFIRRISTFIIVMFGWLLFVKTDGIESILDYLRAMFASPVTSPGVVYELVRSIVPIVIFAVASTPLPKKIYTKLYEKSYGRWIILALMIVGLFLAVTFMISSSYSPFLYFDF